MQKRAEHDPSLPKRLAMLRARAIVVRLSGMTERKFQHGLPCDRDHRELLRWQARECVPKYPERQERWESKNIAM